MCVGVRHLCVCTPSKILSSESKDSLQLLGDQVSEIALCTKQVGSVPTSAWNSGVDPDIRVETQKRRKKHRSQPTSEGQKTNALQALEKSLPQVAAVTSPPEKASKVATKNQAIVTS